MKRLIVSAMVVFSLSPALLALPPLQQQVQQQMEMGRQGAAAPQERPKPSPEMQKRGYDLLQIAEAGASGLDGGMRAFAQLQVARAYELSDKKKALELLQNALLASRGVDDDKLRTRQRLQAEILREMVPLAPQDVEDHLGELDSFTRMGVLNALMSYYQKNNELDRVEQMIYRIGAEQEIPYSTVERLVDVLPDDQNGKVLQLFSASLSSYRAHKHTGMSSGGDFPSLISKTWKRLPPRIVEDAIHEVLSQADPANQSDEQKNVSMSMAGDKGAVAFNSMYQWRLFQLLPVLRQIDADEADTLLKKSQQVQTLLDKYPQGPDSLNSGQNGPDGRGGSPMMMSVGGGAQMRGPSPLEMQRAQKIIADAQAHPSDALANAQLLSNPQMRADILGEIAAATAKKDPAVANSALSKMLDTVDQIDETDAQVMGLRRAADLYLRMGQVDDGKKTVERGLKAAEKMYRQDSNADDPNKALKAYWPSAEAYRSLLAVAGRISPAWAMTLLKDLPDADMKVMAETSLAGAWLNVPSGAVTIMTSNKSGNRTMMNDQP